MQEICNDFSLAQCGINIMKAIRCFIHLSTCFTLYTIIYMIYIMAVIDEPF